MWLTDINAAMLGVGRDRLLDAGLAAPHRAVQCGTFAASAPAAFDCVSVAFGLRNMTHKDAALAEMRRVLKPGGRLLVLEFSKVWKPLEKAYDWYSFNVLPWLGRQVAKDEASYRYLAESIRMHPDQESAAGDDGTSRAGRRRILQSRRGRGGAAPRREILRVRPWRKQ